MANEEKSDLNDYTGSELDYWLKCETWSAKEALCLVSGIEPRNSEINWDGYENALGVNIPIPVVTVLVLLGDLSVFSFPPRRR